MSKSRFGKTPQQTIHQDTSVQGGKYEYLIKLAQAGDQESINFLQMLGINIEETREQINKNK